ncbi:CBS domain-containing protein [Rhodoplanes azumiensis]|uniref:CBS domain-containing protein n=1 Tax=Rhodoplanes azumiensis TaxID=1897628 RepID=A0ABW5AKR4_9BRAD
MSAGVDLDRPFRTMRRLVALRAAAVPTLPADASLAEAARLLGRRGVTAAAVTRGDALAGVVSHRSIAAAAARLPEATPQSLTTGACTEAVPVVGLDTAVPEALAQLASGAADHIGSEHAAPAPAAPDHVAVVDPEGRVVDLLSRADLLAELVWHQGEVIREMRLQERLMHLQGVYSC